LNHIEFKKSQVVFDELAGKKNVIEIYIDGRNFIEMVRDHEMPFALAEGAVLIAGSYRSPSCCIGLPTTSYFQEEDPSQENFEPKVDILECTCGVYGCWPLRGRITVGGDCVIWFDFEQPHRSSHHPQGPWTYENFGPFVFDRQQYELAMQSVVES